MEHTRIEPFCLLISLLIGMAGVSQDCTVPGKEYIFTEPLTFSAIDPELREISGLVYIGASIWAHNDSGGEPALYEVDDTGKITGKLTLSNAGNVDWEDVASDNEFVYIGDFGNNRGHRTDLVIYKISLEDLQLKGHISETGEIRFIYGDQELTKEQKRDHNFDCEALISAGDSLMIFTKNRGDLMTRIYKLPKTDGNYTLQPFACIDAGGLVTGADYHEPSGRLALVGYLNYVPFIIVAEDFSERDATFSSLTRFVLPGISNAQTEGIVFIERNNLLVTSERTRETNQGVFSVDLEVLTGKSFEQKE